MTTPERIVRASVTFLVGVVFATILANVVGHFQPGYKNFTFFALIILWAAAGVIAVRRDMQTEGGALGMFADPREWRPDLLPYEFHFITRRTTSRELFARVGAPSQHMGRVLRYDLPTEGALFIFLEAHDLDARVRAVQAYRQNEYIPMDPLSAFANVI
jgi:hypothetical protein